MKIQVDGGVNRWMIAVLATVAVIALSGCGGSNKSTGPSSGSASVDEDVATSIASDLGEDNGGLADQVNDLTALARPSGLQGAPGFATPQGVSASTPTYDPGSGAWQWGFTREFSSNNGAYFAHVSRTYQWRFLKSSGQPQIAYIVGHDTAYSIEFAVLNGSGRHRTPHLSQTLTGLTCNLVATGTNTSTITVNGTCSRAALDTIFTHNAVRTLDHGTQLTLTDVQCQRDAAGELWQSVSGTITGTFSANITFSSGDAYDEKTVNRDINISLGNGEAVIHFGGHIWNAGLRHGDLQ